MPPPSLSTVSRIGILSRGTQALALVLLGITGTQAFVVRSALPMQPRPAISNLRVLMDPTTPMRSNPEDDKRKPTPQSRSNRNGSDNNDSSIVTPSRVSEPLEAELPKATLGRSEYQMYLNMIDHRILTKEEEQELGQQIQLAKALQERIGEIQLRQQAELLIDDDSPYPPSNEPKRDLSRNKLHLNYFKRRQEPIAAHVYYGPHEEKENDPFLTWTNEECQTYLNLTSPLAVKRILKRGALAREKLMRHNIKLVVSIAKKWARQTYLPGSSSDGNPYTASWSRPSLHDAIQDGISEGLNKAVDRFDPSKNWRFSTYATHWITNAVRICYRTASTGTLRLPANYHVTLVRYRQAVKEYYQEQQVIAGPPKPPSLVEIAARIEIAPDRLQRILLLARPLMSVDGPVNMPFSAAGKGGTTEVNDELTLGSTLASKGETLENRAERQMLRQALEQAMATELSPHERDVLRLRLGLDDGTTRTYRQLAEEYYGGRVRVSDVRAAEQRALRKLRSPQALAQYQWWSFVHLVDLDPGTITAALR